MMVMIDYDDENRDSKVLKMLIVTKLWIGEGILNQENLKAMQKRADAIKITSDLDFALSG
jgi:heptaprenylglyceryl phosphate synthase